MCNFGIFLSEFGCHRNSLCSLENSDNILQLADPKNPGKNSQEKILDFLHRIEIRVILTDFDKNFVANSLRSIKSSGSIFQFIYVKSSP